MFIDAFLLGALLLAVLSDLSTRRIPNWLILSGMLFALSYHLYTGGYSGLFFAFQGLAAGVLLLVIPFVLGGLGAGDVKLLSMIGAIKGSVFAFNSFIYMALWGGIIAIFLLLLNKRLKETLFKLSFGLFMVHAAGASISDSVEKNDISIYYPYGLAIGLGVLSTYYRGWC
ncbi:MAG: prepilin peptidase [Syntrophomonadaceae bacterium]|nr:prepilin peptidase [Syntrophomonadaceae bacterium]